jgi:EAL domain-containing protein (putative c-di-GMP-specific phosphodiesterase class I)
VGSVAEPSGPVAQAALDRALDDSGQLILLYQPIHDPRTGAIYAADALLRQQRENGEIREASIITDAAEEAPAAELFALTNMLVKQAYSAAAQWHAAGFPDVRLNVNLSPREFQEGNVVPRLTELVTSCGIDTHRINLEITETSYIDNPDETMDVLSAMKDLGVSLWLDDFGTGHSSINHLQRFPLDGIKIPGAFVRDLATDHRSRAIVKALIGLANDLELEVIAEEIETEEQLAFLCDLGCTYIQGFLFSRPMLQEDFLTLLRDRRC